MSAPAASTHLPWTHKKSTRKQHPHHDKILWLIGSGKIFYGLLLLGVGIGAFNLIGKNLSAEVWQWVQRWNLDFHNHYVQLVFQKAKEVDGKRLYSLTILTFGYALLFFIEGIGLIMGKYWAKWMVVLVTGSFIPAELYHLAKQFDWLDAILLVINASAVTYLVWQIKTHEHPPKTVRHKPRK